MEELIRRTLNDDEEGGVVERLAERIARGRKPFVPPPPTGPLSIKAVHAAVPKHLFQRSTRKCLFYVGRHICIAWAFYLAATKIDGVLRWIEGQGWSAGARWMAAGTMWGTYWFWESVAFMGVWTLGESPPAATDPCGLARCLLTVAHFNRT